MAFTLSNLLQDACRKVGILSVGLSTAGSSITLVDATLIGESADNDFRYATIFFIQSANSTAIEGQFRTVSSYTAGTGTFAFSSLAASVTNPCTYARTTPEIHTELLIELANDALRHLGDLDFVDTATLGTSAAVDEYTNQIAWKRARPKRLELQTDISSSGSRNRWQTMYNWEIQPSSAGATGKIVFGESLPAGRDVRVWYEDVHHRVSLSTAPVDERIHPELAIASLVEKIYEYRNSLNRGSLPFDLQRWNDAKVRLNEALVRYPIYRWKRKPKLLTFGDDTMGGDHGPWPPPYGPGP